jgi:hypothetical protein
MTNPDRRHAVEVARRFEQLQAVDLGVARPAMAAALLHDCGKVASGLGTYQRVVATMWIAVRGRERAGRGDGRLARYARHEPIGADLLAAAGSDPLTVALVGGRPEAPPTLRSALLAADDL